MDTCKNCGKPLENPDQELCPACRAVENAKARTRREEKAGHARRRRMNRTTRKMLIAVCVLAVVFTGLCVTATVMYDKYNPDEFIASVDAALEAGDAAALCAKVKNVFEQVLPDEQRTRIEDIKHALLVHGAECAAMTGSGSAVFGLFREEDVCRAACGALRSTELQTFCTIFV